MTDNNKQSVDATLLGKEWSEGSEPGNPEEIGTLSKDSPTSLGIGQALVSLPQALSFTYPVDTTSVIKYANIKAAMTWGLNFHLWTYWPMKQSGEPGDPIKVFTCITAPDPDSASTWLHAPQLLAGDVDPAAINPFIGGHQQQPAKTQVDADWAKKNGITGPYLESVQVVLGFDDDRPVMKQNSPDATKQSGSVSTGISYTFGFGFFGDSPTASFSATFSQTHTMVLEDYIITNNTDNSSTAKFDYDMQMWDGGYEYNKDNLTPRGLTAASTSKFPLALGGIWHLDGKINDKLTFHPRVTATYVMIGAADINRGYLLTPGDWDNVFTDHQVVCRMSFDFDFPVEVDFAHTDPVSWPPGTKPISK